MWLFLRIQLKRLCPWESWFSDWDVVGEGTEISAVMLKNLSVFYFKVLISSAGSHMVPL